MFIIYFLTKFGVTSEGICGCNVAIKITNFEVNLSKLKAAYCCTM